MRSLAGLLLVLVLLTACGSPVAVSASTPAVLAMPRAAIAATSNATAARSTPASGTPGTPIPVRPGPPGTPRAATPTTGATLVQLFAPYRPGGLANDLRVVDSLDGYCLAGAATLPGRPDAWRCISGNGILDPCFESGTEDLAPLACVSSPWLDEVSLMTRTAALPRERANTAGGTTYHPWAFQLASGVRCQIITGATATIAGLRINTACSDGTHSVGDIDRTRARWRVYIMRDNSPILESEEIAIVWY